MTKKIFTDVTSLVESAMRNADAEGATWAALQLQAANALATLVLAEEVRTANLLAAATAEPRGHGEVNPELTGTAYAAAVTRLGLTEEGPGLTVEELREMLATDPADQDVES